MVLGGDGQSVEEHQHYHQPIEEPGLDPNTTLSPEKTIPATCMTTETNTGRQSMKVDENNILLEIWFLCNTHT